MKKYLFLTLSLFALSATASNDDIARDIYSEFQKGQIPPVLENDVHYYSGRCYLFDSGIDPTANHWGIVGISKKNGAYFTRFWTLMTDNHDPHQPDPFAGASLEELKANYPTKKKAYPSDTANAIETVLIESPKMYYSVAQSKANDTWYLVGAIRGDTYCKLVKRY
jgi:hypothetical protein